MRASPCPGLRDASPVASVHASGEGRGRVKARLGALPGFRPQLSAGASRAVAAGICSFVRRPWPFALLHQLIVTVLCRIARRTQLLASLPRGSTPRTQLIVTRTQLIVTMHQLIVTMHQLLLTPPRLHRSLHQRIAALPSLPVASLQRNHPLRRCNLTLPWLLASRRQLMLTMIQRSHASRQLTVTLPRLPLSLHRRAVTLPQINDANPRGNPGFTPTGTTPRPFSAHPIALLPTSPHRKSSPRAGPPGEPSGATHPSGFAGRA